MTNVFDPGVYPFTVAAGVMLGLVILEGASLFLGMSASGMIDKTFHLDHAPDADVGDGGPVTGLVHWFNLGGIPFLALLILACAAFSSIGFAIQAVATNVLFPLPASVASLAAFAGAVPVIRYGSRAVSRIVPSDESYAVPLDQMVGRTGTVMLGPLDQGMPGTVSISDRHGNLHTLRARAAKGVAPIPPGTVVLMVEHEGQLFTAIPAPADLLP